MPAVGSRMGHAGAQPRRPRRQRDRLPEPPAPRLAITSSAAQAKRLALAPAHIFSVASTFVVVSAFAARITAGAPIPLELATDPGIETDPALVECPPHAMNPQHASKAFNDTVWIADWTFDASGGGCTEAGWVHRDLRILNDGTNYWSVQTGYGDGSHAAVLRKHDLCWTRDGYGNQWDYSIVLAYSGGDARVSFDFWSDSEPLYDFVTVEADSLGLSESRVVPESRLMPEDFRDVLFSTSGNHWSGSAVSALALPDYGPGQHMVYIRFLSDRRFSDEDGGFASAGNAGLVVDNIAVAGKTAYGENFACGDASCVDKRVQLRNTAIARPFGEWGRLYDRITDNDKCTENTTCAWLWSDPALAAYSTDMAFGPGSAIVRNWLDNLIVSPWVDLGSTPNATYTILSFRTFPGNNYSQSRIVLGWRVRTKLRVDNTDTSAPGDSIDCLSAWGHSSSFNSLGTFAWITRVLDMSPFFYPDSRGIQLSFRIGDWQYISGIGPPSPLDPGPGPYIDRVRIGRRTLLGPRLHEGTDSRTQAQDCFPTLRNGISPGEHFSPSTDRFGTCAFSMGKNLDFEVPFTPNIITGDSIVIDVQDIRGAGGVTSVRWYGAIVAGPHAGKAPAPYAVGSNGFFETTADTARSSSGAVVANVFTRDLDDTYFRGGDVLQYFWAATDAAGGLASMPAGLAALPASVAAAETTTGGLHEVNFLPVVDWDPDYLAVLAADTHGDIDPTPEQIANSMQANCLLYYQHVTSRRRSGPLQATSFMRTLDGLGYAGSYDIYDVQGYGNMNNQLGGRATVQQLAGYRLVVEDDGRSNLTPNIPDGSNPSLEKVDQARFYRDWLAGGAGSETGIATLWIIGESTVFERATNALFTTDFGIASVVNDQALAVNPDIEGIAVTTFSNGNTSAFTGDLFTLNGGCPAIRNYDGYTPGGTAVTTHRYRTATSPGLGAVVVNSNPTLRWNTIAMGFAWFDIRDAFASSPPVPPPGAPPKDLAAKILNAVLGDCAEPLDPTSVPPVSEEGLPRSTVLHPSVPNPFNPVTRLVYDLAAPGRVRLEVYDVAGHRVRSLLDAETPAGFGHTVTWNARDDAGRRVSSGVYLARLQTGDRAVASRRLVLLQ